MSEDAFDPFGAPGFHPGKGNSEQRSPGLRHLGIGAFWVFVVAILVARAMYFVPDLGAK